MSGCKLLDFVLSDLGPKTPTFGHSGTGALVLWYSDALVFGAPDVLATASSWCPKRVSSGHQEEAAVL